MSHINRVWKDYTIAEGFISGSSMRDLDENTFKAINGDDGGLWTPSSPIVIGGAGVGVVAEWRGNGSGFDIKTSANKPISFEAGTDVDYFGFEEGHEGRSPTTLTTLQHALTTESYYFNAFYLVDSTRFAISPANFYPHYSAGLSPGYELTLAAGGQYSEITPRFVHSLNVYNGGKIDTVTLRFSVNRTNAAIPTLLPRFRVVAVSYDGEVIPLRIASDTDEQGLLIVASPATGAAWYNSGLEQTSVYTCNQDHVVDISKYSYFIEIYAQYPTQEAGYASNSFFCAEIQFTDVAVLDGRS